MRLLKFLFACTLVIVIAAHVMSQQSAGPINGRGLALATLALAHTMPGAVESDDDHAAHVEELKAAINENDHAADSVKHVDPVVEEKHDEMPAPEEKPMEMAQAASSPVVNFNPPKEPKEPVPVEPPGPSPADDVPLKKVIMWTLGEGCDACKLLDAAYARGLLEGIELVRQTPAPNFGRKLPTLEWQAIDKTPRFWTGWNETCAPQFMDYFRRTQRWKQDPPQARRQPKPQYKEPWHAYLPAGTPYDQVTTKLEIPTIDLPRIALNLSRQALEFQDSRACRLNRWFSVNFRPGSLKHEGNSIVFRRLPSFAFTCCRIRRGSRSTP